MNGKLHTDGVDNRKLFTPGPLGVSMSTKQAMLRDVGSRDTEFIETVGFIRKQLVKLAGVSVDTHTCVPVQGSGSFAIEAVLTSSIPPRNNGKLLIFENGAYGKRMGQIAKVLDVPHEVVSFPENSKVSLTTVENMLLQGSWTNVAIVHCETSTGVINPITEVGKLVKQHVPDAFYIVDAMSSFGAVPLDLDEMKADFMVSSANKCLEGVPGFSYAIARIDSLKKCKGWSRSMCLDLVAQWEGLEKSGQFRFTPPTHAMLAFRQALLELDQEGGIKGRSQRYQENRRVLRDGMGEMGFKEYLDSSHGGYIITSFHYPSHQAFDFKEFYTKLQNKGQVIYPGKVTKADCFRIGNIGHLFPDDMRHLLTCIREVCNDMGMTLPLSDN